MEKFDIPIITEHLPIKYTAGLEFMVVCMGPYYWNMGKRCCILMNAFQVYIIAPSKG